MRKKPGSLMIRAALFFLAVPGIPGMTVHGTEAGNGFVVTYEDGKLAGDYSAGEIENEVSGMQPGDRASFGVALYNRAEGPTQWYMKNTIVKSMEEESSAAGGAYAYKLTYVSPAGEARVLFDSAALGGEGSAGLHEADEALGDHFYLGTLGKEETGEILLEIGLDGESQGNSYMATFANLSMNFAVMPEPEAVSGGGGSRTVRREVVDERVVYVDENGDPVPLADLGGGAGRTGIVKTGDERALEPYILASCVSGTLLLLYGAALGKKERKKTGEAA